MILVKSPFRVSFFGGSTDYKDFYETNESFIIGCAIDKHVYLSIRKKPEILSEESIISYSKYEKIKNIDSISNPLIRETFRYFNLNFPIEFVSFSDIPSRTGLGGSSSYCVGMSCLIRKFLKLEISKKILANDAINIERKILKESGGIQDQIWASYGGLNSITINKNGDFFVKPLPITTEFTQEFKKSLVLIYSNEQRSSNYIAKSHENKDKLAILQISKAAYNNFLNENIQDIGNLLYESWLNKNSISDNISTKSANEIISTCMNNGAYGAKLLGAGGCGFVLAVCNEKVKQKIKEIYKSNILDFDFDFSGATTIFNDETKIYN
jgi:D-glycero-alpha-D-manno-heptose-7-phosphate kinase